MCFSVSPAAIRAQQQSTITVCCDDFRTYPGGVWDCLNEDGKVLLSGYYPTPGIRFGDIDPDAPASACISFKV